MKHVATPQKIYKTLEDFGEIRFEHWVNFRYSVFLGVCFVEKMRFEAWNWGEIWEETISDI